MMEFEFCCICLKELKRLKSGGEVGEGKRPRRGKSSKIKLISDAPTDGEQNEKLIVNVDLIKVLTRCLLISSESSYEDLDVVGAAGEKDGVMEGGGDENEEVEGGSSSLTSSCSKLFQLCQGCEDIARVILGLQRELDELRGRIEEKVNLMREAVMKSSGWLGGTGTTDTDTENEKVEMGEEEEVAFTNFSKKFCNGEGESWKARRIFDKLKAFQLAVCRKEDVKNDSVIIDDTTEGDDDDEEGSNSVDPSSPKGDIPGDVEEEEAMDISELEVKLEVDSPPSSLPKSKVSDPLSPSSGAADEISSETDDEIAISERCPSPQPHSSTTPTSTTRVITRSNTTSWSKVAESVLNQTKMVQAEATKTRVIVVPVPQRCPHPRRRPRPPSAVIRDAYSNMAASSGSNNKTKMVKGESGEVYLIKFSDPSDPTPKEEVTDKSGPPPKKKKRANYLIRSCETCSYKTRFHLSLDRHLRSHETTVKNFTCDKCSASFTTKQVYQRHYDKHNQTIRRKCDVCQEFIPTTELQEHMRTHVGDKLLQCAHCPHCSSSMDKLMAHICRDHTALEELKCEICGKLFRGSEKRKLMKHLHEVHQAIQSHQCDFGGCQMTFLSKDLLRIHYRGHLRPHFCDQCGKGFVTKNSLEGHQQVAHNGEKTVHCDQCPEVFHTSSQLETHKIREHGAPKLKCEHCDNDYFTQGALYQHFKRQHDPERTGRQCPTCNKTFSSLSLLKSHMESHSDQRNYICDECGKAFQTNSGCQAHKKSHGSKSHQCSYCPKAFTKSQILKEHLRVHTGERPFECDLCGKAFNQRGARSAHRRRCPRLSSK